MGKKITYYHYIKYSNPFHHLQNRWTQCVFSYIAVYILYGGIHRVVFFPSSLVEQAPIEFHAWSALVAP